MNTIKTNIINDFLIFVIEEYKYLENINAIELIELFTKNNIFNYITNNYDVLHTMGGRAIADDINCCIINQGTSTKNVIR